MERGESREMSDQMRELFYPILSYVQYIAIEGGTTSTTTVITPITITTRITTIVRFI